MNNITESLRQLISRILGNACLCVSSWGGGGVIFSSSGKLYFLMGEDVDDECMVSSGDKHQRAVDVTSQ